MDSNFSMSFLGIAVGSIDSMEKNMIRFHQKVLYCSGVQLSPKITENLLAHWDLDGFNITKGKHQLG